MSETIHTFDTTTGQITESQQPETKVVTSIVIPAYNEEKNIGPLVEEISEVFDEQVADQDVPYEVVFVDDGSEDATTNIIEQLASAHEEVRGVILRRNFGQSAAMAAGIDHALGQWIVTMDADRQNNPADIPALLDRIREGYDCVSGWRRDRDDPLAKKIPSAIQTKLLHLGGENIHDYGCTLKAYRSTALQDIELYGEGHRYIPAQLYKRGYRVTEQVVDHRPRTAGKTKYGWHRILRGFVDLLFHMFWNRYSTRPSHLLGGTGVVFMSIGTAIGLHATIMKYGFGVSLVPRTPRLLLTIALVVFGLQLVMFGFLAEMISKLHYKSENPYRIKSTVGSDTD